MCSDTQKKLQIRNYKIRLGTQTPSQNGLRQLSAHH